jgi:nicotinamidase/pyrazinamidase
MRTKIQAMTSALLIVDLQYDFIDGTLAVPGAQAVVKAIDELIHTRRFGFVTASRDLHPFDHCSFSDHGGRWPVHCLNHTRGAALAAPAVNATQSIVSKGRFPDRDAYSAFDGTDLTDQLRQRAITDLIVVGLATDYCVRASVLDALGAGFAVTVLSDCIAGVNVEDSARAEREMVAAGARVITSQD